MTEIPFSLIHGYITPGAIHFLHKPDFWRIGVQVYYTIDGVRSASDIVYLMIGEEPEYILGDVNGDHEVDINDVSDLISYLLDNNVAIIQQAANIDGNSEIDINDLTDLIDMVLGL